MSKAVLTCLILTWLLGCGGEAPGPGPEADRTADTSAAPPSPPAEASAGEDPQAAVQVVHEYYRAIATGEHDRAWRLWADGGRASGQSLEEFRRGFAGTDSVAVRTGPPGRVEGAAGSRYVSVPVVLRAWTTGGREQCFQGPITLRKGVVPGATLEQMSWRLHSAELAAADPGTCAPEAGQDHAAVVALVQRFGERLADVPLTAPPERARAAIRESYGELVAPALLETWLADPRAAPGREVSSPWPDGIEVEAVRRRSSDRWEIDGEVVLMTSVGMTQGGDAGRRSIGLDVSRTAAGWRISGWTD